MYMPIRRAYTKTDRPRSCKSGDSMMPTDFRSFGSRSASFWMFDLRPGPWDGLIHSFDGVPPDCLEGLVTLRCKVIPGLRFIKCLHLLQAVPLGDGDTLGSRPLQCNVGGRGRAYYAQRRTN